MEDYPLVVFSREPTVLPLGALYAALSTEGYPGHFSLGIAGEATEDELASAAWEAAFLRWEQPELHDVALVEFLAVDHDPEAPKLLEQFRARISAARDLAGRMIVADHLSRTQAIWTIQLLPALLAEEDHSAWAALDLLLRLLAQQTDGLIYAESEGYCDADGELLLAEPKI